MKLLNSFKLDNTISLVFIRWSWMRAFLHNGWWLVTSLYLVIDCGLTSFQLLFIGVAQGIAALVFEIPTGIFADTISRKWSLVISQLLMGLAMLCTGLVKSFPLLMATQMLWGVSWNFASGADTAWVTDELNDPLHTPSILAKSAQAQLSGAAIGLIGIGILAWRTSLSFAMVSSGMAMLALGGYVVLEFRENNFTPIRHNNLIASWEIFREGGRLVRKNQTILVIFIATFIVNGAAEIFTRLFPQRLTNIGFPNTLSPIVWFTGLNILTLLVGAGAVWIVKGHMEGSIAVRRAYAFVSMIGTVGLVVLACATSITFCYAGVLLTGGIALPLTRILATIEVNNQTMDRVRATVHSFLAQAEYLGEIICGTAIGILVRVTSLSVALACSGALLALTVVIIIPRAEHISGIPPIQ